MIGLMSRASELFLEQPPAEKRRLLQVVVEKAAWKGGELQIALFEPFEILRRSNRESSRKEEEKRGPGRNSKIWLPGKRGFQQPLRPHRILPLICCHQMLPSIRGIIRVQRDR